MKLMSFFRRAEKRVPAINQPVEQRLVPTRRYRDDVPYALPKDLEEGNRLNLQHYLFRYALGGNYVAPLEQQTISHILDIGSGTGKWGQEMALQFPGARVFGLDLEPPQTVSASSRFGAGIGRENGQEWTRRGTGRGDARQKMPARGVSTSPIGWFSIIAHIYEKHDTRLLSNILPALGSGKKTRVLDFQERYP